ncbi:MAG: PAS domain-containing sensor histidine kinase, partial [Mehylophilales bacterium 35-46-6]
MIDIRWKAFFFVCTLCVISLFVWLFSTAIYALLFFSSTVLAYLAIQVIDIHALQKWFKKPQLQAVPEGVGLSENIFSALLRYERANQQKKNELNG